MSVVDSTSDIMTCAIEDTIVALRYSHIGIGISDESARIADILPSLWTDIDCADILQE
jgi:hypothetical protein